MCKNNNFGFLIILLLLILVSISSVMGLPKVDNAHPRIKVEYRDSADEEISILDKSLRDNYGNIYELNETVSGRVYVYSPYSYLYNGDYFFTIVAQDKDENIQVSTYDFTVEATGIGIWGVEPKNERVKLGEQHFIFANKTPPFDIRLESEVPAVCKIMPVTTTIFNIEPEDLYNSANYRFNGFDLPIDAEIMPSTEHYIKAISSPITGGNSDELAIPRHEDYEKKYRVICKVKENGEDNYYTQDFIIGYDTSAPNIANRFSPKIINDQFLLKNPGTIYNISSDNDPIICSYNITNNPMPAYEPNNKNLFNEITSIDNYYNNYSRSFNFSEVTLFQDGNKPTYNLLSYCENPAGFKTYFRNNFSVMLEFKMNIVVPELFYTTSSPTIDFLTTISSSNCEAVVDDDDITVQTDSFTKYRLSPSSLDEGEHQLEITCETSATGDVVTKSFILVIDSTAPLQPVIDESTSTFICSDDMEILINYTDDDVTYNFTVTNGTGGEVVYEASNVDTRLLKVPKSEFISVVGDRYEWIITAHDAGGLVSSETKFQVTKKDFNDLDCDMESPSLNINVEYDTTTPDLTSIAKVNLTCYDGYSGCTDSYDYKLIDPNEKCVFSSTGYTSNNYYDILDVALGKKVCYIGYDMAGNTANGSQIIDRDLDIKLIKPRFGIDEKKVIELVIEIQRDVTCKHGPKENLKGSNEDIYEFLSHKFTKSGVKNQYKSSFVDSVFTQTEEDSKPWIVICEEDGIYHKKEFELGYDITPANVKLDISPNVILDAQKPSVILKVTSDDPVVCSYKAPFTDERLYFEGYNPESISSYKTSHRVEVVYWGEYDYSEEQEVVCKNIAQTDSNDYETVKIKFEDKIGVRILNKKYWNTQSVNLNVGTVQDAKCQYRFDIDDPYEMFTQTGNKNHTTMVNLEAGEYKLEVMCKGTDTNDFGTRFQDLVVDLEIPEIGIIVAQESCDLDKFTFHILSSGTGSLMDRYEYILKIGELPVIIGNTIKQDNEIKVDLVEGTEYTIYVKGYDMAGNVAEMEEYFIATEYTNDCDTNPPNAKITELLTWGGKDARVDCTDKEGDCNDIFGYFENFEGVCSADNYAPKSLTADNPIGVNSSRTICTKVFDMAGNMQEVSKYIKIKKSCYNEIEDPDEEGVDCGGICSASCGTCYNGKKDPFELGIDCDGVCESVNVCGDEDIDGGNSENEIYGDEDIDDGNFENEDSCEDDYDCGIGEKCSFSVCVEDDSNEDFDNYVDEDGISILGIILIVVGILCMGGGSYFIYYSRQKKAQQQQQQNAMQQQQNAQAMANMQAAQRKAMQKKLADMKARNAKQIDVRNQHRKDIKDARSSLLGNFDLEDKYDENKKEEVKEVDKKPLSESIVLNTGNTPKVKGVKNKGKLDENMNSEYLDLSEHHDISEKDPFANLKKIAKEKGVPTKVTKVGIDVKKRSMAKKGTQEVGTKLGDGIFAELEHLIDHGKNVVNSNVNSNLNTRINSKLKNNEFDNLRRINTKNAVKLNENLNEKSKNVHVIKTVTSKNTKIKDDIFGKLDKLNAKKKKNNGKE